MHRLVPCLPHHLLEPVDDVQVVSHRGVVVAGLCVVVGQDRGLEEVEPLLEVVDANRSRDGLRDLRARR